MPEAIHERLSLRRELDGTIFRVRGSVPFRPRPYHTHDELEFNLITAGNGSYVTEAGLVDLQPGLLIWLFPSEPHSLHAISEDFAMWVAVFKPRMIRQACHHPPYTALRSVRPPAGGALAQLSPAGTEALHGQLEALLSAPRDVDLFNARLRHLLLVTWKRTLETHSDRPAPQAFHPAVYRAAILLYEDPAWDSFPALAQRCGLSYEHLARLFRKQMRINLTDYRNEQRLRRFRSIYGNGERVTLMEAAFEAGFGSYAQCFRICRKLLGRAPSDLRASHVSAAAGEPSASPGELPG